MAIIKPFKALRPSRDKVHLVASRSFDTYSPAELSGKLKGNPYTFLHIIKPDYPSHTKGSEQDDNYLHLIKAHFNEFIEKEYLVADASPAFYLYQQFKNNQVYTGIIACAAIDDYFNGVIKIHEQTLTEKETRFKEYLEVCDFNAEPVCISYPDNAAINKVLDETLAERPEYDFSTRDEERHKLWLIDAPEKIKIIENEFSNMDAVYIADGHHRSASSALLGKSKREANKNYSGEEGFNYFMCVFFSEKQLHIYDFNRVVKDLNGLTTDAFITQLNEKFEVQKMGSDNYTASKLHNLSMYVEGNWYSLTAKSGTTHDNDPVGSLDASILSEHILNPILGIQDLKTDKRVRFVSGIKGMQKLKELVDEGKFKVAFGLYPVSMQQLKNIADNNCIMPPKTTWIEPKLRSGLVIYSLGK
ncbi:MAG: DUF1015 domain-containing protein [Bacteroidetes bacterium]|nr:DUF1015 domain-containing protein [Bacteroidota bacterium]